MARGIRSSRRCTAISIRRARGRSVRSSTAPNSPAITSSRFATMKAAEKLLAGPDLVVDGLARASAAISLVEASESNELEDSEPGELQGILKTFTLPVVFYARHPATQTLASKEFMGDECGSRCPCIPDRRPAGLNACIVKVRKQIDETVLFFCGLWRISRCNNLAALTRHAPNISVRLHRVQVLGTSCNGRPRFGRCRRGRCRVPSSSSRSRSRRHRCPSSIPRQLTFPPMVGLAIRIELANLVSVQCPHDADPREHRRPPSIGTKIKASIAACHSGASCCVFGTLMMLLPASY